MALVCVYRAPDREILPMAVPLCQVHDTHTQRATICCHSTNNNHIDIRNCTIIVISAIYWTLLPEDGSTDSKHAAVVS
jgi:hypothetical protein